MGKKQFIKFLSVTILVCANYVWPQTVYPPIISVPVTYFDFHPDGSCPDINPGANPSLLLWHMVADTLGSDSLPVRGDSILYSFEVGKWFRPWRQGNDFERPVYTQNGRGVASLSTALFDTSYKNMVYNDTLTFTYVAGSAGLYRYSSSAFWPLDNRGYGNEPAKGHNGTLINPAPHNYSFAMHLRKEFRYASGLTFTFGGNDDIWVFINRKLALDLGGIHAVALDSVVLDSVNASRMGLVKDSIYGLDVFFAERQADQSTVLLTTQVFTYEPRPYAVSLKIFPESDTLTARGDSIPMFVVVADYTGAQRTDLEALVQWTIIPSSTLDHLKNAQGGTNMFYEFNPYAMCQVVVEYQDPSASWYGLYDTCRLHIRLPSVTHKLCIESDTVNCSGSGVPLAGC